MIRGKRGQGLSINAVVLIVLAVAVLIALILGFILGWDSILPWIKTSNVDSIKQACEVACSTQSTYEFCSVQRELKDDENVEITTSCSVFDRHQEFDKYGFNVCNLNCETDCEDIKYVYEGTIVEAEEKGSCDSSTEQDITSIAKITGTTTDKCCIKSKP